MAHPRTAIRHAVRDLLIGKTVAGKRVTTTRVDPYREAELPAIAVYTLDETIDSDSVSTAPRLLTRQLDLAIAGFVAGGSAVDDAMDALALQIETAMHADPYLGDLVAESVLAETTLELQGEGDKLTGLVTLTYAVTYRSEAPEAPADLDDFLTADTRHDLGGEQANDDQVEDLIVVQEVA